MRLTTRKRHLSARRTAAAIVLGAAVLAPIARPALSAAGGDDAGRALAVERAFQALEEGEALGPLGLESSYRIDEDEDGVEVAALEVLLDLDGLPADRITGAGFVVTLVLDLYEADPVVFRDRVSPGDLSRATGWLHRATFGLPEDLREVAVVVEEPGSGLWGAVVSEIGEFLAAPGPTIAVTTADLRPAGAPGTLAAGATATEPTPTVVRLVPSRQAELSGRVRFRTLVSSAAVQRVVFFLDGRKVAEADRSPFDARIDLGPSPAPHTVRVIAYGSSEIPLGEHSIDVNRPARAFRVEITGIQQPEAGWIELTAEVAVPVAAVLAGVEFYLNEDLVERLVAPPYRVRVPSAGIGGTDYVRVVARLEDGSSSEDARLLAAPGSGEEVEVNLVELYVLVTGPEGGPVRGLAKESFTIVLRGKEQPIERFAVAEDLPLALGLVIDTSESMWTLMPDTRKAAAQFLQETLEEEDRGFVVDFDTRPRLAQALTDDPVDLLTSLGGLRADGFTALFDAVIFGVLQFDEPGGRKALVVLTDGDDYRSQFSPGRAIESAKKGGVPVYVIGLGGLDGLRRSIRKIDLEGIADLTGGRVYYLEDMEELAEAYSEIGAELRSQYLLAFSTEHRLQDEELDELRVKVPGKGFKVRTVVAGRTVE